MNRREFIMTSGAASVGTSRLSGVSVSSTSASEFSPWLEIDTRNLEWNVQQISRQVQGRPVLAVIKANAYGHGLVETARHLQRHRAVFGFAVFKVEEGLELRESGLQKPILVLGPASESEIERLVEADVRPSIFNDHGPLLARLVARRQKPVKVHLYLDTGLGRMGIPYYEAGSLIEGLSGVKGLEFEGILTPLTEDEEFDREQLRRLQQVVDQAAAAGVDLGLRHAASSAGVVHEPEAHLDMVRPGICLYGCYPDADAERERVIELRPSLSLKTSVMYVKRLRAGDSLQYHRAYVAAKPTWIATLPVGYSDGWLREAANRCVAQIGGRSYPIVATVTSNHTLVELGPEKTVETGAEALLFGSQVEEVRPHEVSRRTGVSVYSLLIETNPLLRREYV